MRLQGTCTHCGRIDVGLDKVDLHVDDDDPQVWCALECPGCGGRIRRRVDGRMVRILEAAGVTVAHHGRERPELAVPGLPPLTPNCLVEFQQILESADWFLRLLESTNAGGTRRGQAGADDRS